MSLDDPIDLPCGCHIEVDKEDRALIMLPCSLGCEHLRYVVTEFRRRGKDIEYRKKDEPT